MATIAINDTTPELTIEEQFPAEVTPESHPRRVRFTRCARLWLYKRS